VKLQKLRRGMKRGGERESLRIYQMALPFCNIFLILLPIFILLFPKSQQGINVRIPDIADGRGQ